MWNRQTSVCLLFISIGRDGDSSRNRVWDWEANRKRRTEIEGSNRINREVNDKSVSFCSRNKVSMEEFR